MLWLHCHYLHPTGQGPYISHSLTTCDTIHHSRSHSRSCLILSASSCSPPLCCPYFLHIPGFLMCVIIPNNSPLSTIWNHRARITLYLPIYYHGTLCKYTTCFVFSATIESPKCHSFQTIRKPEQCISSPEVLREYPVSVCSRSHRL